MYFNTECYSISAFTIFVIWSEEILSFFCTSLQMRPATGDASAGLLLYHSPPSRLRVSAARSPGSRVSWRVDTAGAGNVGDLVLYLGVVGIGGNQPGDGELSIAVTAKESLTLLMTDEAGTDGRNQDGSKGGGKGNPNEKRGIVVRGDMVYKHFRTLVIGNGLVGEVSELGYIGFQVI